MNGNSVNYIGMIFGRLTVISEDMPKYAKRGNRRTWLCKCSCGNSKVINHSELQQGKTKSCGCLSRELASNRQKGNTGFRIEGETSFWNLYIHGYKSGAKTRNIEYKLTGEQFKFVCQQNCHYCNAEPVENFISANAYSRQTKINNVDIDENYRKSKIVKTNGIDRVDNNKGYILDNIVACCRMCNISKRDYTKTQFEDWIRRAFNHLNNREKNET